MISAQEARAAGPIADYLAVSRELQTHIWRAIHARKTSVMFSDVYLTAIVHYDDSTAWHHRLVVELEALSYEVSAEGVVSW
jgi:hypothetical protein